jgi:hypothetical protein
VAQPEARRKRFGGHELGIVGALREKLWLGDLRVVRGDFFVQRLAAKPFHLEIDISMMEEPHTICPTLGSVSQRGGFGLKTDAKSRRRYWPTDLLILLGIPELGTNVHIPTLGTHVQCKRRKRNKSCY